MSGNRPALALANEAYSDQGSWRKNSELIDALPYVDSLESAEKVAINALIEEEVGRLPPLNHATRSNPSNQTLVPYSQLKNIDKKPSDYLKELPPIPPSRLESHQLIQTEFERISRGEQLDAMDIERYNLNPPPPSKRSDPAAWQAALDNANAQLEHQRNRLLNLELLLKFGPSTWRAHNEAVASYASRLKNQVQDSRNGIENLNKERKLQQIAAGRELFALEEEYLSLVTKNAQLESVCQSLEEEISRLDESKQ